MGVGSAILALKELQGNNECYRDAVLYACLHDTRYDWQCECDRHYYLYEAINLIGNNTFFEEKIIERLRKSDSLSAEINYLGGSLRVLSTQKGDKMS